MPIAIDCDDCGKTIDVGNEAYCEYCVGKLKDKIADLEQDLGEANKEIRSYEEDVVKYQETINELKKEK